MVLLTNGQMRKTLSVVRSLGCKGIGSEVSEVTRFTPAGFSKYCIKRRVNPDPKRNPEGFYQWLMKTIEKTQYDVLIPMDDDIMEIVMANREEIEKKCRLPLPQRESYDMAFDKGLSTRFAIEAGMDCPRTVFPDNTESLLKLTAELQYPMIIKPRKSSGSRGIRIVNDEIQLIEEYKHIHKIYPFPLIQEYIGIGDRYDVCLLYDSNSTLKASFVQKELRHFPVDIGPSTVQESVVFPELLQKSLQLMEKLKWFGVVEIEFMIDQRDNKPKFMEINPRFWNSLQMAVLAGVDFPWMLYKLAMRMEVEEIKHYKTGTRCQWLLPGDILHYLANRNKKRMNPPLLGGKHHHMYNDTISRQDPFPILGFILACLRYVASIRMWKFLIKR